MSKHRSARRNPPTTYSVNKKATFKMSPRNFPVQIGIFWGYSAFYRDFRATIDRAFPPFFGDRLPNPLRIRSLLTRKA
jgi:hypothetical protein